MSSATRPYHEKRRALGAAAGLRQWPRLYRDTAGYCDLHRHLLRSLAPAKKSRYAQPFVIDASQLG